jgi:hypothetical protein
MVGATQQGVAREKEVALMRRIISVLAVAALLAAMLVATALPAFAVAEPKVPVCHQNGNGTFEQIEVGASAVGAHLAHGDTLGTCDLVPPP